MRTAIAWAMLAFAVVLDALVWLGVIAQEEPQLVLHLSLLALAYPAVLAVWAADDQEEP